MSEKLDQYYTFVNRAAGRAYSEDTDSRDAQFVRGASSLATWLVGGDALVIGGGEI
ncbi:MAG: hypothetical protein G01um101416_1216 [Microgenomates group bacterium Gr01-1014_16]|nr:MAG: hypothetical protein G01um101416_1216 [Microgenomates group bacterium Gr01-1014_16]